MNRYLWMSIMTMSLLAGMPARAQPPSTADTADEDAPAGAGADPSSAGPGNPSNAGPGTTTPTPNMPLPWVAGVPLAQRQQATGIFQEGNRLIRQGVFALAADRYREALALWDHPGFGYNLAITQINLDQPIAAYESFLHATRYGAPPLGDDMYTQAQSFLTLLRNQLAHIEVVCDEPGAVVTLDGKPLFTAPGRKQLMALPGGHQLMADSVGRQSDTRQIVLAPGQRARFTLAPQLPVYLATERRWPAWRPWAVTGAGLVMVAAGAVIEWRAGVAFDRHDDEAGRLCLGLAGCAAGDIPAGLYQRLDWAERLQLTAHATYAVGGAVLAGGAVLLYLNRERPVRRRGLDASPRVSLLPVLAPRVTGLSARFVF